MDDIISKLLLKWFNWKMKSVRYKIKNLNAEIQKELIEDFEEAINNKIDELIININTEIEWLWATIENDIEDAEYEERTDEENIEVWSNDE